MDESGDGQLEALQDVDDPPDVDRGKVTGSGRVTGYTHSLSENSFYKTHQAEIL